MAEVRGTLVVKTGRAWHWNAGGAEWTYAGLPDRGLWRNRVSVFPRRGKHQPLCVDDAVIFSLGWEHSHGNLETAPPEEGPEKDGAA